MACTLRIVPAAGGNAAILDPSPRSQSKPPCYYAIAVSGYGVKSPRTKQPDRKVSFSTRISPKTLQQLDKLVRSGSYPNRTAAIEAVVERLVNDEEEALERRLKAVRETAGVFSLKTTPERLQEGQNEYDEWLAERLLGRPLGG